MRNFFLSFFKTKQKLYTKLIIFLFLVVNTFFTLLECNGSCNCCEECCEKYFGCNFGSKKKEEENVKKNQNIFGNMQEEPKNQNIFGNMQEEPKNQNIFGNIQGEPIDINNSENFNTLSVVFGIILGNDLNPPEDVNIENIQEEENFDQFKVSIENFTFCVKLLKENYEKIKENPNLDNALNKETVNLYTLREKPNFLNFYGSYIFQNRVFICTDYCDGRDLKTFIDNLSPEDINSELYKSFSRQLFNILQILRENKITHRNIKLENFFVIKNNNNPEIVLCDFRSSRYGESEKDCNLECTKRFGSYFDFNRSPICRQYFLGIIIPNLKKFKSYNAYNEDLFAVALILYYLKNEKKYPTFVGEDLKKMNQKNLFEKTIQDFNNYFDSDDYKNHDGELYNKIFLKFKDKNNNDTIDINEFINGPNP